MNIRTITLSVKPVQGEELLLEVSEGEARMVIAQLQRALTPGVTITKEMVVSCWEMAAEKKPHGYSTFIYAVRLLREKTRCGLLDGRNAMESAGYRLGSDHRIA